MLWETFPLMRHQKICSPKSYDKIPAGVPLHVVYYLFWSKVTLNSPSEVFSGLSLAVFERGCCLTCHRRLPQIWLLCVRNSSNHFVLLIPSVTYKSHATKMMHMYLLCTSGVTSYSRYIYLPLQCLNLRTGFFF